MGGEDVGGAGCVKLRIGALLGSGEAPQGEERRVIYRLIKRVTETTSGLLLTSCRMAANVHHVLELVMPYRREGEFL